VSERRPATTIGELDIHLGNVMDTLSELQNSSKNMERTLATLATRDYVDDQVRQVNERIHQAKPTTQLLSFSKIAAAVMVLLAFFGLMAEFAATLREYRQSMPKAPAVTAKP
jgi:hypothetical protein